MIPEEQKQEFITGLVNILQSRENVSLMLLMDSDKGFEYVSTHSSVIWQLGVLNLAEKVLTRELNKKTHVSEKSEEAEIVDEVSVAGMITKIKGGIN